MCFRGVLNELNTFLHAEIFRYMLTFTYQYLLELVEVVYANILVSVVILFSDFANIPY